MSVANSDAGRVAHPLWESKQTLDRRRWRARRTSPSQLFVGFATHIVPILSKAGCYAGACHASQYGQGGFKLSVFASDPQADHQAMVRADMSRRVSLAERVCYLGEWLPVMSAARSSGCRNDGDGGGPQL